MNGCPEEGCKKKMEGHHLTLFGRDGRGGLVAGEKDTKSCLQKKVSRKGAIVTAIAIISMLLASGTTITVYGLEALKTDRDAVGKNTNNISKIQVELKAIREAVTSTQTSLDEIQEEIDKKLIDPKALERLIENAVKAGNEDP